MRILGLGRLTITQSRVNIKSPRIKRRRVRRCMKAGLPVIGLSLNANRCPWRMGDFYENSIDMIELEKLVSAELN